MKKKKTYRPDPLFTITISGNVTYIYVSCHLSIYLLSHVFRIDPRALKCFKISADISFLN